jgi:hypothetical protein
MLVCMLCVLAYTIHLLEKIAQVSNIPLAILDHLLGVLLLGARLHLRVH